MNLTTRSKWRRTKHERTPTSDASAASGAAGSGSGSAGDAGGGANDASGTLSGAGLSGAGAISVILEELPPSPGAARAAAVASSSQHTSSGHPEGELWLVVEYCDGRTLSDAARDGLLGRRGAPDALRLLTVLRGVAAGMAYLHSQNVVHRDLKANNVLVTDFGLSRMMGEGQTHRSTRTVGTITHMPPELLRFGQLSAAGDVYAFGIIMWEAFTGESAFKGMHYGEVVEHVLLRGSRPPVLPVMPQAYAKLMTRCWSAAPGDRPTFDTVLQPSDIQPATGDGGGAARGAQPL
ncbi:hypothetical protein MNEG_12761 [Monoraphidium neglectum]|uniref:Protein kinase domain-containing protein n=1 Tax=Monoraphidium neglectum TaxID=145388 RepID=A0A0D2MJT7_9CHLO|nr:hypothetical protein MNEG_12761 [Monoraphidium neglectum]KIY95200.1 hypothetical protein MNEG_12761 [Monoraphidium neglectum]|eukprot:XP_013894220.1 hypothetical protein MNEG_12761 [Monoraphidium neglectum]